MAFKMKGFTPFTTNNKYNPDEETWWDKTKYKLGRLGEEIIATIDPNQTSLAELGSKKKKKKKKTK